MDALMQTALVGTARQPDGGTATGTAVDSFTGSLDSVSLERRILLTAGAAAVYRLAGQLPAAAPMPPAVCPVEARPACPPGAAHLLATLFGSSRAVLLTEALGSLARAGYVLPHELLVQALSARDADLRAAIRPVLGERGRWLARQNSAWEWAAAAPTDDLPPDAELVWQEGSPAERREVFRRLRLADPARAHEWLAAAWSSEQSETRCDLLRLLAVNLSADDEAALERALADRASSVRSIARPLLARLSGSAFARRMLERADSLLTVDGDSLKLTLPRRLDDAWKHDGIQEHGSQGPSRRAWWAVQVLSLVPPAHWQAKTQRDPVDLLAALPADDAVVVVEAWSHAAILYEDEAWMPALWDWWQSLGGQSEPASKDLVPLLFLHMPQDEAECRILRELAEQPAEWERRLTIMLSSFSIPWSESLGRAYLLGLREHVERLTATRQGEKWPDPFAVSLDLAALAIPLPLVPLAREPFPVPDSASALIAQWSDHLKAFAETLALRQRIREEIPG